MLGVIRSYQELTGLRPVKLTDKRPTAEVMSTNSIQSPLPHGRGRGWVLRFYRLLPTLPTCPRLLTSNSGSTLQRSFEVQVLGHEGTSGTGTELDAGDVLRDGEIVLRLSASLRVLDTEREDGEVINLHVLALQEEFLDTRDHVGQQTPDDALRIGTVVVTHVLGKSIQVDGLFDDWVGKPHAEYPRCSVLDFLEYVTNHS